MKSRVCMYLASQAPKLAAKTVSFLSNRRGQFAWSLPDREMNESLLVEWINWLAIALETEDPCIREQMMVELTGQLAQKGESPPLALERFRVCRDVVLQQLQVEHTHFFQDNTDLSGFLQVQLSLYRQVDQFLSSFLETYHRTVQEKARADSEAAQKAGDYFTDVAEQELVQLVLNSSDIAVLMIDRNLNIVEANSALAELIGVDRNKIIGQNIDEAFRPPENERFAQWVVERGISGHYVAEYNGRWVTVSTSPIYHEGEMWGAISVLRSITDGNRYEEEWSKREALAAVGQLAAGMAHEIRNPLTSIKGFIQLLREQSDSTQNDSYFSVILTEIERIDGLLNDVLVLARYRDEKTVNERFLLMDEVHGVMRLLEPEANRRGIKLELKQLDEEGGYVYGHRARIKQAILNILKNAFEALVANGTTVQVSVFGSLHQIVVTVEDDGPGLSEEIRKNLFVPFYTTKPDGTGLGLSTTQRIIVDHGGEIQADNSPVLGGARFVVRLPLASSPDADW